MRQLSATVCQTLPNCHSYLSTFYLRFNFVHWHSQVAEKLRLIWSKWAQHCGLAVSMSASQFRGSCFLFKDFVFRTILLLHYYRSWTMNTFWYRLSIKMKLKPLVSKKQEVAIVMDRIHWCGPYRSTLTNVWMGIPGSTPVFNAICYRWSSFRIILLTKNK